MATVSTTIPLGDEAGSVFEDEPVRFAYLFGSHARGEVDGRSDVDVAVYVDESMPPQDYLDLRLRLAGTLEAHTPAGPVQVVVLNEAPLPLAGRVVAEGRLVFSRDEPGRVRYESLIFREFTDFDHFAGALDLEIIRAHAEGRR
jgi:uncharacterized protein